MENQPITPDNQEPIHKRFMNHKLASVAIIVAVLAVATCIAFWQKAPVVPPTPTIPFDQEEETADWKTYSNTEYGFEFKYPNDWQVIDTQGICVSKIGVRYTMEGTEACAINVSVNKKNPSVLGIDKLIEMRKEAYPNFKVSNIKLGGRDAVRLTGYGDETYLNAGDLSIVIGSAISSKDLYPEIEPVLNQILSTFKFTGSVDTSTWETYTNTQYGFSIKYPSEGKVVGNSVFPNSQELIPQAAIGFEVKALGITVGLGSSCWKQTTLDGKQGEFCDFSSEVGGPYRVVVVPLYIDSKTPSLSTELKITIPITSNSIYEQILSTFKFIQ